MAVLSFEKCSSLNNFFLLSFHEYIKESHVKKKEKVLGMSTKTIASFCFLLLFAPWALLEEPELTGALSKKKIPVIFDHVGNVTRFFVLFYLK